MSENVNTNGATESRSHDGLVRHLRYDMYGAPNNHPQEVMKKVGITYQHATPQSMGDQWWFWNCQNIPEELPSYLEFADWNRMEMIGWGLSKEKAEAIRDFSA